jgi:hypothetical protein
LLFFDAKDANNQQMKKNTKDTRSLSFDVREVPLMIDGFVVMSAFSLQLPDARSTKKNMIKEKRRRRHSFGSVF